MLDQYVYNNLRKYGNTIIGESAYKRFGKNKILKDLEKHGFNCNIRIVGERYAQCPSSNYDVNNLIDRTIIIEVIK